MLPRMNFYILGGLLLGLIFWGCDSTPLTSGDEITTHTFESMPGSSLEQSISTYSGSATRYTCWITTLNEPGSEVKYTLHSSIQFLPDLDYAKGRNNKKQKTVNWSFVITDKAGTSVRSNWRHDGRDNVIRRASCNLPDMPSVEKEVGRRLSQFADDHWLFGGNPSENYKVFSKKHKVKPENDEPEIGLSSSGPKYFFVSF